MQVEAGVLGQPRGHVTVLVGGVVVEDQVDGQALGDLAVDGAQELQEPLVAVARQALADDPAGTRFRGDERRSRGASNPGVARPIGV